MLAATNISKNSQFIKFAKYNSMSKFVDLQYIILREQENGNNFCTGLKNPTYLWLLCLIYNIIFWCLGFPF